jgi:hypothetical protein
MSEPLAELHVVRTRVLLGNLTPEQRQDLVDCLYDVYGIVRAADPHDGRTRAGRAWAEASHLAVRTALAQLGLVEDGGRDR